MVSAKERDRILLHGTIEEQRAMLIEVGGFTPSNDEVVLRAVNKAITALTYMPADRRELARKWLKSHNSESWG
jgi:hypothetical protein